MVLKICHLVLAGIWLGSMTYSLLVVQPKVARFFREDESQEAFLIALAHGNRRKVLALLGILLATAIAIAVTSDGKTVVGYYVALGLYLVAGGIFVNVSWRHWPARVFAVPAELAGFRQRLRVQATSMTILVGAAFVIALGASVR